MNRPVNRLDAGFSMDTVFSILNGAVQIWMNSDVAEIKEMNSTFWHEFGHFLDTAGVLPVPRSKRRMRNVYISSAAAKRLRDDHDAMLDAGRGAPGKPPRTFTGTWALTLKRPSMVIFSKTSSSTAC